jgi:hypothetical protein
MIVNGTKKTLLLVRDLSEVIQIEKSLQKQEEETQKVNLATREFSSSFSKLCYLFDRFVGTEK